jgi:hypothetical protein
MFFAELALMWLYAWGVPNDKENTMKKTTTKTPDKNALATLKDLGVDALAEMWDAAEPGSAIRTAIGQHITRSYYHTPQAFRERYAKQEAKARLDEVANRLAAELGIHSLEVRNLDRYDFHEVYVTALKRVLQRAFVLGMQAAESEAPNIQHYIDAL